MGSRTGPVALSSARRQQRIYAVCTHKGGVGKTTTAVNLGACLVEAGRRVLLVDQDPQGHASEHLGLKMHKSEHTPAARLLIGMNPLEELVTETPCGLHLVRGGKRTSAADSVLRETPEDKNILRTELRRADRYDVVLIDCPPSYGPLVQTALRAADGIIVPLVLDYYSASGLADLLDSIEEEQEHNRELAISYVFAHNSNPNTTLAKDVRDEAMRLFPQQFLTTAVRINAQLRAAPGSGAPITTFASKSNGAEDYRALTKELIERGAV